MHHITYKMSTEFFSDFANGCPQNDKVVLSQLLHTPHYQHNNINNYIYIHTHTHIYIYIRILIIYND